MQNRMRTHPLTEQKVKKLLLRSQTGSLATLNADGAPYITPVHFVYFDGAIFFHGLPKGQKLDNIARDSRVGFSVHEMDQLLLDPSEKPCETNTKYESVIISGAAKPIHDTQVKTEILRKFVEKYTPHLINNAIANNMAKGTVVIRIDVTDMSGKYYL